MGERKVDIKKEEETEVLGKSKFFEDKMDILDELGKKLMYSGNCEGVFDYENFNYEECFEEVKETIKIPNILVCGGTGVGKSSLIKAFFDFDDNEGPVIGTNGRPETIGVRKYSCQGHTVNLYDSEGFEVGEGKLEYFEREVIGFIDKLKVENPGRMENHIHEVWYCVSAGNKRFFDNDLLMIKKIAERNVPIMILITKVDLVDEDELNNLFMTIHNSVPKTSIYTYSTELEGEDEDIVKRYVQKEQIIRWAVDNLDEALKIGFIPAMKTGIEEKRKYILKNVVPGYVAAAAATVVGTSLVDVPFTDSVPLMAIQVKMAVSIISAHGINAGPKEVITGVVGTNLVSYVGRTIASQLLTIIPGIGGALRATVNVSVAATVTAFLGAAINVVCEQYLKACVDNGGSENLPFSKFFSSENLQKAMEFVKLNKGEFGIEDMITMATKTKK